MLTLITGGARSGKSSFAQSLCGDAERVVYLATATRTDDEMSARIGRHRADRPSHWSTVEEPLGIPSAVSRSVLEADFVLLDCVTVWLSNLLLTWQNEPANAVETKARRETDALVSACMQGHLIAVTNEVGSGIVPTSAVGRLFRDLQGLVNQQLAAAAQSVYFLAAGIPLRIKPNLSIGK